MKKFFYFLALSLACSASANAAVEDLSLSRGWNCNLVTESTATTFPNKFSYTGQYGQVNLIKANFDVREYVSWKITFSEPLTTADLQMKISNTNGDSGSGYYIFPEGATEVAYEFQEFKPYLDPATEDFTCTVLAVQFKGSSSASCIVSDFVLITEDGEEFRPDVAKAGWNASTEKLGEGETTSYYSFSQWGTLAHNFGENVTFEEGDAHIFTVTSSEPFPEGLQWKVVRGSNDSDAIYPSVFPVGETEVVLELSADNIKKTDDDEIDYYTGIAIQARSSLTLPSDVKMTREIVSTTGVLSREQLPVIAGAYSFGGDAPTANVLDPEPGEETGANGLPCKVSLPGSWGAIKIWKETFNVAEYPMFKIVLRERPSGIQMFYRTETHGSSGGEYITWESHPEIYITVSEDGRVMEGEFNLDALGDDLEVLAFCLQNTTDSTVSCIVEAVYLYNEDGEEIETSGLSSSGIWNGGSTIPLGGTRDENGNLWDAIVELGSGAYLGTWSARIPEGTYHRYTFYFEEPFNGWLIPMAQKDLNWETWQYETQVTCRAEGDGTDKYSVNVYGSYDMFFVMYYGDEDTSFRVKKIVRELYEGEEPGLSGVETISIEPSNATVVSTKYYNVSGIRSERPVKGLNIVRETLSDGSIRSYKVMRR